MYWPTSIARSLVVPAPLHDQPIDSLRQNRKGNFFISLSKHGLGVWDVRPCVLQAAIIRTPESVERWGSNIDACWAHDGRGIIVLTSTSHLLIYQLVATAKPSYDYPSTSQFPLGGGAGEGDLLMGWTLRSLGVAFVMGGCESVQAQTHTITCTLRHPPSILTAPYPLPASLLSPPGSHHPPPPLDGDGEEQAECEIWDMEQAKAWMECEGNKMPAPKSMATAKTPGTPTGQVLRMEDGRVWMLHLAKSQADGKYIGQALHTPAGKSARGLGLDKAVATSINPKFGLVAVGTASGVVDLISLPHTTPSRRSTRLDLGRAASLSTSPGAVTSMAWTSDGYALAVGYEHGWAVWTVGGRLNGWGMALSQSEGEGETADHFAHGVVDLFWVPGNLELVILANAPDQLYILPFAKSATTGQNSPDNTRHAFLQMDDRVLIYRGGDKSDVGVINPESDAWHTVRIPPVYMSTNWPLRYASISTDGQLVAVAGRRGLTHYSSASGKWKLFGDERQEQDFTVRGGLLWFHHVLIVAVEVNKTYQIRLYSRDQDLADANTLHAQPMPSPVLVMSLLDNSLLVYTADNTLYHFLILPTKDSIRIHPCGSISFAGIVQVPSRVRALSWLIPEAQKRLGDPADDLVIATIIFLVDGKLVLLRPRRAGSGEVRYDLQVLADRIECYWTHLHGVGTLENSLWGYDGERMRVWLDALTVEHTQLEEASDAYADIGESVAIRLDFYPLSILMDKGVIIGVDHEASSRALPFDLHKLQTSTHLFLPQFMRYHLLSTSLRHALVFGTNYASLVYFAHSLEMLLHAVLEDAEVGRSDERAGDEADKANRSPADAPRVDANGNGDGDATTIKPRRIAVASTTGELERAIEFLDHFPDCLDVVVGCARKTELERWTLLFAAAGDPRTLYEACLAKGKLRSAAGYLLVLHTLEKLDDVEDTVALIRRAIAAHETRLCKELLRFLHSIDESGDALRRAIAELDLPQHDGLANGVDEIHIEAPSPTPAAAAAAAAPVGAGEELLQGDAPIIQAESSIRSLSLLAPAPTPSTSSSSSSIPTIKRITSPFQLESPRLIFSPPSPRTVGPADEGKVPTALSVPDVD